MHLKCHVWEHGATKRHWQGCGDESQQVSLNARELGEGWKFETYSDRVQANRTVLGIVLATCAFSLGHIPQALVRVHTADDQLVKHRPACAKGLQHNGCSSGRT